jgi:RNA polymerase sigma-70 factor (ECF subfamily)
MASNEQSILSAFETNRQQGVATVIKEYHQFLIRVASHLLGDEQEACDAVQQVYIKLLYGKWHFSGRSSVKTYIASILINVCRDILRKKSRRAALMAAWTSHGSEVDDATTDEQRKSIVRKALLKVPLQFRIPLQLCEWDNMKYDEIALTLHIPVNTVKSRIARARLKLSELLIAAGVQL